MRTATPMSPPRLWILALAMVSALSATSIAYASWPHSPGINVPICTATGDQGLPKSVSDGAGGAIITWYDARSGINFDDVYVQHVLASGAVDPAWPANGLALCTAANGQGNLQIVSDGAGGAIVTWNDFRNASDNDIYAQHVLSSGTVDGAWPVNGTLLCGAANVQQKPTIVSDGAGGAIVTWMDFRSGTNWDIYAQRVRSTGVVDPAWPVNGTAVCIVADEQNTPAIVSDGAAGAIITWYDHRTGAYDIYAQRVLASGVVDGAWPVDGRALCTAGNDQYQPVLVSDGAGGAIVTWYDERPGVGIADIYAQRVLPSGVVDPAWPLNGRVLCAAGNQQYYPSIVSDGAGGAIVAWQDARNGGPANLDVYAQHVLVTGVVDGAWPVDGRALCNFGNPQINTVIVSDGAGGAIVAWEDYRPGPTLDVYAQHVLASGVLDTAWPTHGSATSTAPSHQFGLTTVSDGAGGAIVAWHDLRSNGVSYDIYAQRVAGTGYLGNPDPVLGSVRDVPNDNGGKVKLSWSASYLDTEAPYIVDHYWIFRSSPPNLAEQALASGAQRLGEGAEEPLPGEPAYLVIEQNAATYYWEFIASSPAAHFTATYGYVASTNSDSVGASNPRTAFLVVAYNASNTLFFLSNPDSGYSVDNLPPLTPEPFAANSSSGSTYLEWNPNSESDLAFYRIHRGASADFEPGPGNLIASPTATDYTDAGTVGAYYKISAVDVHGNESGYALLAPSPTADAGDGIVRELSFGRPAPNPAGVRASVRLALPRAGRVTVAIHDIAGRQIRSLIAGDVAAGERDVSWDLRDASGARVADGVYFMKLEAQGRSISRPIAVVR